MDLSAYFASLNLLNLLSRMPAAVAQGLITGKSGGRLDPGGTASRAEVSAILMRYVQSAQA